MHLWTYVNAKNQTIIILHRLTFHSLCLGTWLPNTTHSIIKVYSKSSCGQTSQSAVSIVELQGMTLDCIQNAVNIWQVRTTDQLLWHNNHSQGYNILKLPLAHHNISSMYVLYEIAKWISEVQHPLHVVSCIQHNLTRRHNFGIYMYMYLHPQPKLHTVMHS